MDETEAKTLAKLFANKFIVRPYIRAIQSAEGEYRPQRNPETGMSLGKFDMEALLDHLYGRHTYGHYMVNPDGDKVKFFALDIDLEKTGKLPSTKFGEEYIGWEDVNPREFWMSRRPGPGRDIIKLQLKMMANKLARIIHDELEIPTAVAYSGSKGVHVYGFTGSTTAAFAREAARITLTAANWELFRGNNFYRYKAEGVLAKDNIMNMNQYSLEVYPKQDSLDGKDLGNLIRLPLGVNLKSPKDKPFFLDMRTALSSFSPMSPIEALTTTDMWRYPGE